MRLFRFAPDTVPPQYASAFCDDGTWRAGVDLSHLPEPMRREVAWCIFWIIDLGGTIPTPGLSMLVRPRISEICLLDRDPLLPLLPAPASSTAAADGQAAVARLRYQQTKIDGAPDTVLVDAAVVAIIREQQEWAGRFFAGRGAPGKTPKYLSWPGR